MPSDDDLEERHPTPTWASHGKREIIERGDGSPSSKDEPPSESASGQRDAYILDGPGDGGEAESEPPPLDELVITVTGRPDDPGPLPSPSVEHDRFLAAEAKDLHSAGRPIEWLLTAGDVLAHPTFLHLATALVVALVVGGMPPLLATPLDTSLFLVDVLPSPPVVTALWVLMIATGIATVVGADGFAPGRNGLLNVCHAGIAAAVAAGLLVLTWSAAGHRELPEWLARLCLVAFALPFTFAGRRLGLIGVWRQRSGLRTRRYLSFMFLQAIPIALVLIGMTVILPRMLRPSKELEAGLRALEPVGSGIPRGKLRGHLEALATIAPNAYARYLTGVPGRPALVKTYLDSLKAELAATPLLAIRLCGDPASGGALTEVVGFAAGQAAVIRALQPDVPSLHRLRSSLEPLLHIAPASGLTMAQIWLVDVALGASSGAAPTPASVLSGFARNTVNLSSGAWVSLGDPDAYSEHLARSDGKVHPSCPDVPKGETRTACAIIAGGTNGLEHIGCLWRAVRDGVTYVATFPSAVQRDELSSALNTAWGCSGKDGTANETLCETTDLRLRLDRLDMPVPPRGDAVPALRLKPAA